MAPLGNPTGYKYEKLPDRHIRLLKCRPGPPSAEPAIEEIFSCGLKDSPDYDALSYVWDKPLCTRKVAFGEGGEIHVPVNVFLALKWLQQKTSERWLWIDAVCINQKKKPDKEQREPTQEEKEATEECEAQVRMMGEIYSKAKRVFMCFGVSAAKYDAKAIEQVKSWIKSGNKLDSDNPVWTTLMSMRSEDYFTRTWTIQEVILAEDKVFVLLRDCVLSWSQLLSASKNEPYYLRDIERLPIVAIKRLVDSGNSPGLLDLLKASATSKATDKRDKIYALLGLVRGDTKHYPVKYGPWTAAAAFAHYTFLFCQESMSLDPLEISRKTATTSIKELPSWAIDFSCIPADRFEEESLRQTTISSAWEKTRFCAHDHRPLSIEMSQDQDLALNIRGCKVDEITSVSQLRVDDWKQEVDLSGVIKNFTNIAKPFAEWDSLTNFLVTFICTLLCIPGDPGSKGEEMALEDVKSFKMESDEDFESFERRLVERFDSVHKTTLNTMYELCKHNSLFVTKNLLMGMGAGFTRPGDTVCILDGGRTPFILRHTNTSENEYRLVGECYVHGIMQGEWMRDVKEGDLEWFRLA